MNSLLTAKRPEEESLLYSDAYLYRLARIARQRLDISQDDDLIMGLMHEGRNLYSLEFDAFGKVYFRLTIF